MKCPKCLQPFTMTTTEVLCKTCKQKTRSRPLDAADCSALKIPDILFDGYAVFMAMTNEEKSIAQPQAVATVLDAVVRILRKQNAGVLAHADEKTL